MSAVTSGAENADRIASDLARAFVGCLPLLPEPFRQANAHLLVPEHLGRLANRLAALHLHGVPAALPSPHLHIEATPPLSATREAFRDAAEWCARGVDPSAPEVLASLAGAVTSAGTAGLLLLLGQRRTPGSVTDERAIPPPRAELLAAAAARHGSGSLTVAARALAKHAGRGTGAFWGEIRGSVDERNRLAAQAVARVLDGATWWNVFCLAGGLVYEARLPSGHGARWSVPAVTFIGLVEPFEQEPASG